MAVTIVINGTTVSSGNCTTSGNTTTCTIAGTYGNVTVTNQGGTAQVVFVDSATLPVLRLVNARFLALANAVNGSVTFSATSTQGIPGPRMVRQADGWLVRVDNVSAPYSGPANRGRFNVDGVVTSTSMNPESIDTIPAGGDTAGSTKIVMTPAYVSGEINANVFKKEEVMSSLSSGPRTLKGEFTFYLPLSNDFLKLTEVKVETLNPVGPLGQSAYSLQGYVDMWVD